MLETKHTLFHAVDTLSGDSYILKHNRDSSSLFIKKHFKTISIKRKGVQR